MKIVKKIKGIIILLFINYSVISCQSSHKVKAFESFKNSVSREVFESFPVNEKKIKLSTKQKIIYPEAIPSTGYSGFFLQFDLNQKDFEENVNIIDERKLFSARLSDSCNIKIPTFMTSNCKEKYYPIPNIYDKFNELDKDILDGEVFVFGSKLGKYINSKELLKTQDNGYSNGAFVSYETQKIIYWIIIW